MYEMVNNMAAALNWMCWWSHVIVQKPDWSDVLRRFCMTQW